MAEEQIIVDIRVDSKDVEAAKKDIDSFTDSIEELGKVISNARENNKLYKKTIADLDKQLSEGKVSTESHRKQTKLLNDEIKKNNISIAKSTVELSKQKRERKANINLISSEKNAYDALSAKLNLARKRAKNLGVQFGINSKQFKKAADGVSRLDSKLKLIDDGLGQNTRTVGKYSNALKGLGTQLLGAVGITAGLTTVITAGKAFLKTAGELISITKQAEKTFGLTGNSAKVFAADVLALAETVDKDYNQILEAANVVSKELDISATAALAHIQEGFAKGSNNTDEFLDILKEYPAQFRAAGIDAGTMFAIINQQVEQGIYSDKGVDAIKEGGLRLRENTKAVQEALEPLDESIKLQIEQEIAAGNSFKAIQLVSGALNDTSLTAEAAQTIIADVFGGAGEDAGLRYLQTLENIETSLENVATQATESEQASLTLSRTWNRFVVGVADDDSIFSKFWANFKLVIAGLINEVTTFFNLFKSDESIKKTAEETAKLNDELDKNTDKNKESAKAKEAAAKKAKELAKEELKAAKAREKANKARLKAIEEIHKRTESSENKLIELDNKRRLSNIDNAEKLRDERIKIESEATIKLLANDKLLAIEKEAIVQQSIANIIKINDDFDKSEAKRTSEETKRKKAANQTIQEVNKDAAITDIERKMQTNDELIQSEQQRDAKSIELAEELKDKLIEFEKAKTAILLEDETLLAEERQAIILESEQKIQEIENEFADEKTEKNAEDLEKRKELLQDFLSDIIQITGRFAGEEIAVFGKIAAGIAKAFEDGKITAENALEGISIVSNAVFDNIAQRRAEDLMGNEAARQKELELAEGNAEAQDNINEFFDKKARALKLKQFNADKARALIDIAISTAVAVVKTFANLGFPAGIPASIAVGAFGLAQGILVATKKPPEFGKGTDDIVNIGGSHASGNDTDVWGYSGGKKQYFGKVERGEAMPVIRKSAANDYQIAKLNGRFNSSGRKRFAGGTPDITDEGGGQNNEVFVKQMVNAFSNINIVAKIEDITKEAGKKIEIVDNSKV